VRWLFKENALNEEGTSRLGRLQIQFCHITFSTVSLGGSCKAGNKLKSSKVLIYVLIVSFLISSCGKDNLAASETIVTTECSSYSQLPLNRTILTVDDMLKAYPIFESENRWTESIDSTEEVINQQICDFDCAKQVWDPTTVEILLVTKSKVTEADQLVLETSKTYTNILEITDRPYLSNLAPNAWISYNYSQSEFVLLYSYGSVFVQIINRPYPGFDDFAGEFDLTYAIGKTQNKKLCGSGYGP